MRVIISYALVEDTNKMMDSKLLWTYCFHGNNVQKDFKKEFLMSSLKETRLLLGRLL